MDNYGEYLKTDYWLTVSKAVKARAGYRCQVCNSQHDLQAHHRTYDHRGRELDHLDDLVCLCRRCHAVFHGKEGLTKEAKTPAVAPRKRKKGYVTEVKYDHEGDMPRGESIELTMELINRLRTDKFAFTNATLRVLGLKRPLISGWPKRLVGKIVSRQEYLDALKGRNHFNTGGL